ncbi:MAG: phosphomethylpyrimidine synthase ThiC [Candidatus Jettenia sp.]|uniref:Phosphomethylpyrimidine synthase n=1 Tax=Candidatus Jettenia caeni TaxID=247490 RepID=I3IQN4_9BACT|nr:phosphomethylpyrimidine synthase ThiC [Candidatus Jettenia sp. AMX1]MBC6929924.1 phosphomethylpyrimidine synthase ThiC [Candidatus Jettenia sp.]NUN22980.1 phosphomethylpyrimidine synthase ThiC [Candidatus Jettenia caeni]KAA0248534.1 MAG: phosphomethylpyrimidine synthase ThiC [Candidatus Jettenia sp. AMX1]MCE7881857.1 phosphomethylpyrimidine synthase ThiC [Candidatus Jettenia sp. AMX1]MCQ3928188.1 phosphomethylpyrimidine synthase ThiC [Candidatus Jettenia sp.]
MTQLQKARQNIITQEMRQVAKEEDLDPEYIKLRIAEGKIVIPVNHKRRATKVCGIGAGLKTKVNANIGTSADYADIVNELEKLRVAEEAGADAVMDLSTGGDLRSIRRRIIESTVLTVGSVPIYEAAVKAVQHKHTIVDMTAEDMLDAVRLHCEDGVDFITVHCGATRGVLKHLKENKRICGVVSRGGTFLVEWMVHNGRENPFYEEYDEILAIAKEYDVTLSLGDAMRPGALADAFDRAQIYELNVLAELAQRALDANVQVMVEGPGHVPLNQVTAHVQLQKELCKGVPFYVLGPIVTDIAPGYDHITSAIGGAIAAAAGADFLCYVTPTEHLSLPNPTDVRNGVMAARIAAHAADIVKGVKSAWEWDKKMSHYRRKRDWQGQFNTCIDPIVAKNIRERGRPQNDEVCSMCAEYCVFKLSDKA